MNLANLCRTCLTTTDTTFTTLSKFEVNGQLFFISDMLFECTNINVVLEDDLPKSVCLKCLVSLRDSYFFRLQCLESQSTLEMYNMSKISNLNNDEENNELNTKMDSELTSEIEQYDFKIENYDDVLENIEYLDNDLHDIQACLKLMTSKQNLDTKNKSIEKDIVENDISNINFEILNNKERTSQSKKLLRANLTKLPLGTLSNEDKGDQNEDLKPYKCQCGLNYCRKSDLVRHRRLKNHMHLNYSIEGQIFNVYTSIADMDQISETELSENKESSKVGYQNIEIDDEYIMDKTQLDGIINTETFVEKNNLSRKRNKGNKMLLESVKEDKIFVCFCGYSYSRQSDLEKHKREVHPEGLLGPYKYNCSKCFKNFVSEDEVVQHKIYFHDRVKCIKCRTELVGTVNLKRHDLRHHSLPFVCSICKEIFNSTGALNQHKKSHTNFKSYLCNVCGKSFKGPTSLMEHNRVHTNEKPFACRIEGCIKKFKTAAEEKVHFIRHTNEKNYTCEFCGKMFPFITNLNLHRKVHTNEKPFVCTVCQRAFRTKSNLSDHNKTHTGERPYPCKFCDRRFALHTALRKHIRRHMNDKPHKCPYCTYASCTKDHLVIHIRTHTGERPYPCSFPGCTKAYSTNTRRKNHMKTHNRPPKKMKLEKSVNHNIAPNVPENNDDAVEYIIYDEENSEDYVIETLDSLELGYNNIVSPKEHEELSIETYFIQDNP